MRYIYFAVLLLCISLPATAAPPTAKLISVKKIWDQAPHCAFTDLAFWKGHFVCAFREGRAHVATDGKIRDLSSPDGENWSPSAVAHARWIRSARCGTFGHAGRPVDADRRSCAAQERQGPRRRRARSLPFRTMELSGRSRKLSSEPGRWLWRVELARWQSVWHFLFEFAAGFGRVAYVADGE